MKKSILFSVILALFCTFSYAQKGFEAKFSQPSNSEYKVAFSLTDWSIQHVQFDGEDFQQIVFNNSTVTNKKGWAELPFISAAIQLPARKNVDVSIALTEYTDYQLDFPLVPSRGTIYRNQDPTTIPYTIDPESIIDRFYPADLATADEPYIIRDVRGTSIRVFPFQYNAATQTLRVYSKVDVLLTENNEPATNPLLTENPNPLREMRGIYPSLFLNYAAPKIPLFMAQHGEILVITTQRDAETIDSYIQWKREKGYTVYKEIVATGTNVKTLIQQKFNANNNILYVQLVGDWQDIKSDLGGGASAPTDPKMGCVVGTDNLAEIAVGRFSCSNATQLTTQINKAIQYEKNPDMGTWYSSFIGMGSNDTGPADDGEKDWLHVQRIYDQRLVPTYNYNQHYRLYENEGGCTASNLANYLNTGASTIAYCGHGSEVSFVTTGFDTTNVKNLNNGTKLPFIVSVACVNGAFHYTVSGNPRDCFAEHWLKKQNGGAVVTWMSSINQPWAPPMRGQDYFYDILIGGFGYTNGQYGIATNELRTNWGAIVVNAGDLMLTEASSSDDVNTVHTWTTFGDVSLQLRTKQPAVLEVSGPPMYSGMAYSTTVTANGAPVKDALVCISQDGVYLSAFTNENGDVSIENEFLPGTVKLVVSAFNTNTIYENIECIPPSGPYMIYNSSSVVNGDKLTYISENSEIEVTLKNVGVAPTSGTLTVAISCDNPLLTINTGTAQITESIPAGGTATVIFKVTVDHSIPDGISFPVNLTITGTGKVEWNSKMTLKAYAPDFDLDKVLIDGVANGNLTAGTVATITTVVKNKGGADAYKVKGALEISSPYVTLACEEFFRTLPNLAAGETIDLSFTVIVSPNMPYGHEANFNLLITAQYGLSTTADFKVSSSGSNNYCIGESSCSSNDKFTSVVLKKTSDNTVLISNSSSACAANGYQDYTNMVANLEAGQQYTLTATVGSGGQQTVRGWFDFNGNNTFDSNEQMIAFTCAANGSNSQTFTVPENFTPGTHRFRLRCRYSTSVPGMCDNFTYGQTHDYTIVLPELYARVQNVNAELSGTNIAVTWEAPAEGTPDSYNIYRNGNKLNSAPITTTTFTETNIQEGIYAYNVTAVYGANESYAQMSNVVCNITVIVCTEPVNVAVAQEGNNAKITWEDSDAMEGVLLGYNIFRNGTPNPINAALITTKQYIDENLAVGEYTYQISAKYEDCESDLTDPVTINILPCEKPQNPAVVREEGHIALVTWEPPVNSNALLGYNVYRDGELRNEELITELEYRDILEIPVKRILEYTVSAVYAHCESELTDPVKLDVPWGIDNYQDASYSIFPNPTTGELRITNYELRIAGVELFDVFGKMQKVEGRMQKAEGEMVMDISNLPAGVYFVKIYSEAGTVVRKVVKM